MVDIAKILWYSGTMLYSSFTHKYSHLLTKKMRSFSRVLVLLAKDDVITLPDQYTEEIAEQCYNSLKRFVEYIRHETEALRLDLQSGDIKRIETRLSFIKELLGHCGAPKLETDCAHFLLQVKEQGPENIGKEVDVFISRLFAFSIAIQTAEHCVLKDKEFSNLSSDEARRHILLGQLEQHLKSFDDEAALQVLTQLEPLGLYDKLAPIRKHVAAFEFNHAVVALLSLRKTLMGPDSAISRKPIILAVDDKPNNLVSLKAIIGDKYRFVGVTSGSEALQYVETNIPDVYILDIVMPEMDGFELAAEIHRKRKFAPMVFLTASATAEYVTRAYQLGVTDFLVKPCTSESVHSKLERIIGSR